MMMDISEGLAKILPADRFSTRYIDLVSYASDAGFYYLVPKAIAKPKTEEEVIALFHFSKVNQIPLVFRTGGTSLSGQAITDGILVDLSQFWDKIAISDAGDTVRVQPGITGAMVNAYLKPHQRKIGPDPASIAAAMMGGILSNNASGMCCGVKLNSYHTTKYIRFILPDGKLFDTEIEGDYIRFESGCRDLFAELKEIKSEIIANDQLYNKIRNKYQTKNTVGYSLNSFIDHEHPLDILAHLLIGAEGTLAFIAGAVLNTVPDYKFKSTALLYFPDIYSACQAIDPLNVSGALMVELMDRASLKAVENLDGMPAIVKELPAGAAALLVEFQADNYETLAACVNAFLQVTPQLNLYTAPIFSSNPVEQEFFWKVRKGLFPAVGAVRASGTTVILEDITFPVPKLGDAILDLQELFIKYDYDNAIIFGHARDGNIHFVVTQAFDVPAEIDRYDRFLREVVALVVNKYDGSLKAEHGTGRNMSPFVETEWGGEAYQIMKRIKQAVDPQMLLNPGVIINNDKHAHIKDLKELPVVESEVDKCIECGFCEHKCPSRNITATPRRRIVIRRVLQKLKRTGDKANHDLLLNQYQYDGLETCAVDGLCATACPVDINTGDLVKRLRRENHSALQNKIALLVARNFKTVHNMARFALKSGFAVNSVFGNKAMYHITAGVRKLIPAVPLWSARMSYPPKLAVIQHKRQAVTTAGNNAIIYFPACISRVLGTYEGKQKNIMQSFLSICEKSGIPVQVLDDVKSSCCSQIFSSKGFNDANNFTANDIISRLWIASDGGRLAVISDVSSCAYTLKNLRNHLTEENQQKFDQLKIYDSVEFLHDHIMPKAVVKQQKGNVVLHPVCSLQKMKTADKFTNVAKYFAANVTVPKHAGCCGMAGDRGFLFPELTDSATMPEALEVKHKSYDAYYSSTKTCEIAMSEAVDANYQSILYLVDEAM